MRPSRSTSMMPTGTAATSARQLTPLGFERARLGAARLRRLDVREHERELAGERSDARSSLSVKWRSKPSPATTRPRVRPWARSAAAATSPSPIGAEARALGAEVRGEQDRVVELESVAQDRQVDREAQERFRQPVTRHQRGALEGATVRADQPDPELIEPVRLRDRGGRLLEHGRAVASFGRHPRDPVQQVALDQQLVFALAAALDERGDLEHRGRETGRDPREDQRHHLDAQRARERVRGVDQGEQHQHRRQHLLGERARPSARRSPHHHRGADRERRLERRGDRMRERLAIEQHQRHPQHSDRRAHRDRAAGERAPVAERERAGQQEAREQRAGQVARRDQRRVQLRHGGAQARQIQRRPRGAPRERRCALLDAAHVEQRDHDDAAERRDEAQLVHARPRNGVGAQEGNFSIDRSARATARSFLLSCTPTPPPPKFGFHEGRLDRQTGRRDRAARRRGAGAGARAQGRCASASPRRR